MSTKVHPTAIVDHRAELEDGVEIGPYCVVGPWVRIGADTVLHNHVTIHSNTTLGRENVVYPYAVLGAEPQDLKFQGLATELVIGDRNKFREHCTIHRGTELGGYRTVIGNDCLIMVAVHIAHDCVIEDEVVIANNTMLGGHCHVCFGASMGGGAGVHHFTTIGTLAFVGGMSRINRDVPPYMVVEGTPAEVRKVNTTALARRKWTDDDIERVRHAHKLLFREESLPAQTVVEMLRGAPGQPQCVLHLCDFVERAQLGVFGRQKEAERKRRGEA